MATRTKAPSNRWEWIRHQRERAGISANRMARLLDISERAYRKWESAPGTKPEFNHLVGFCEATGANIREATVILYGVAIPGYLKAPMDVLVGAA